MDMVFSSYTLEGVNATSHKPLLFGVTLAQSKSMASPQVHLDTQRKLNFHGDSKSCEDGVDSRGVSRLPSSASSIVVTPSNDSLIRKNGQMNIIASPGFYRSENSFSLRVDRSSDVGGQGGRHLDNFYSSRRSVYSPQYSNKSLEKGIVKGRSHSGLNPEQKLKNDPRQSVQPDFFDNATHPVTNDTAPRRPNKRASIRTEPMPEQDIRDLRRGSNESYTKYPERLFKPESESKHQKDIILYPAALPATSDQSTEKSPDKSPRRPIKRVSMNNSTKDDIIFIPLEDKKVNVTHSHKNQNSENGPRIDEDSTGADEIDCNDSLYLGCDSSVTSELTSPTLALGLQRNSSGHGDGDKIPTKLSAIFQQGLKDRRHEKEKEFDTISLTNGVGEGFEGHSARSSYSRTTRSSIKQGSTGNCSSIVSNRSHLSLSSTVNTLLKMAADVINSESLDHASVCYQKASQAAGLEIMNINVNMGTMHNGESSTWTSTATRSSYHEDLRLIGVIISMMRTKMALLFGQEADYERAIDLCRGALQVQRHQPALKLVASNFADENDMASLMFLIIERLEKTQACLEDHKELLDKIDLHSRVSDFTETETLQSSVNSSTKEIVLEMLERSAHDDQASIFQYDECTLEMLSVHTAELDKHEEGIKYCRDALQIHLVALGLKHPNAGKSLLRVARMYRGKGSDRSNEDLVLGYFQQTAAVLQCSNLSQPARVSVLNDIAVIHMRRFDFDEAIKFLLDALHVYEEDIDDDTISAFAHIATLRVWRNLGECYMHLEKFSIAEGALLKALAIQRDCRKMQDAAAKLEIRAIQLDQSLDKLTTDNSIADTICRIGNARAGSGDHKKALGIYRDALAVLNRKSAAENADSEYELLKKRDQLSQTLFCIAKAESAMNKYEKAVGMFQLSLKLRTANGSDKKDNRKSTFMHCLSCKIGVGDVYMAQKSFASAIEQFNDAVEYASARLPWTHVSVIEETTQKLKDAENSLKSVPKKSPKILTLEQKADAEIERGALDMATETLKELLVIHRAALKQLKEHGLETGEQVYAIACLLQTFGFVFAKNGDDENAERAFKDASRLFRKGGQSEESRANL